MFFLTSLGGTTYMAAFFNLGGLLMILLYVLRAALRNVTATGTTITARFRRQTVAVY